MRVSRSAYYDWQGAYPMPGIEEMVLKNKVVSYLKEVETLMLKGLVKALSRRL